MCAKLLWKQGSYPTALSLLLCRWTGKAGFCHAGHCLMMCLQLCGPRLTPILSYYNFLVAFFFTLALYKAIKHLAVGHRWGIPILETKTKDIICFHSKPLLLSHLIIILFPFCFSWLMLKVTQCLRISTYPPFTLHPLPPLVIPLS